mmetsp:Transcript_47979/g.155626  ORF Transcript_47979/g.155626 Transcript_47979/m.155626 type:complete len:210 (-) Transcript_47979:576-1205(-)
MAMSMRRSIKFDIQPGDAWQPLPVDPSLSHGQATKASEVREVTARTVKAISSGTSTSHAHDQVMHRFAPLLSPRVRKAGSSGFWSERMMEPSWREKSDFRAICCATSTCRARAHDEPTACCADSSTDQRPVPLLPSLASLAQPPLRATLGDLVGLWSDAQPPSPSSRPFQLEEKEPNGFTSGGRASLLRSRDTSGAARPDGVCCRDGAL